MFRRLWNAGLDLLSGQDWLMECLDSIFNRAFHRLQEGKGILAKFNTAEIIIERVSGNDGYSHIHYNYKGTLCVTAKATVFSIPFTVADDVVAFSEVQEALFAKDEVGRINRETFEKAVEGGHLFLEQQIEKGGPSGGNFIVPLIWTFSNQKVIRKLRKKGSV